MAQNRIPPRRGNSVPLRQTAFHEADTIHDDGMADSYDGYDGYDGQDDEWPPRSHSNARRYQPVTDAQTGGGYSRTGKTRPDVRTLSSESSWQRRDEERKRSSTIPPRSRATQTGIPAVQVQRRRPVQSDDGDEGTPNTEDLPGKRPKRHIHWLVFLGGAMLIMVLGWVVLSMFASWWQVTQDDWHYGRPRTYQTDTVVGHNDGPNNPSHFIALNLNSHIEIIEFPGGDATKARVYIGPTLIGPGQDLAPATLDFRDVNGDGKVDMIVTVGGSHFVFINDNGSFRPARTTDNIQL